MCLLVVAVVVVVVAEYGVVAGVVELLASSDVVDSLLTTFNDWSKYVEDALKSQICHIGRYTVRTMSLVKCYKYGI